MQTTSCTECGTATAENDQQCSACGISLPLANVSIPYTISIKRLVLMTSLSGGLYFFYWFYLTWRQFRDHTGEKAYPVWHAMTQSVPVYGLFRVHAHMRCYSELIRSRGLRSTINPMLAVTVIILVNVLSLATWLINLQDQISQGQAIIALALAISQTAITVGLLANVQGNLNRYWHAVSTDAGRARVGAGEVILAIMGSISWLLMFGAVASESFRP